METNLVHNYMIATWINNYHFCLLSTQPAYSIQSLLAQLFVRKQFQYNNTIKKLCRKFTI